MKREIFNEYLKKQNQIEADRETKLNELKFLTHLKVRFGSSLRVKFRIWFWFVLILISFQFCSYFESLI